MYKVIGVASNFFLYTALYISAYGNQQVFFVLLL